MVVRETTDTEQSRLLKRHQSLWSTYRKKVLLVINRSNIIIISEVPKRMTNSIFKIISDFVCVRTIDKTAAYWFSYYRM